MEYLTLNITYDSGLNEFRMSGDVKRGARKELVAEFLRTQMGAGIDKREPIKKDIYHISLKWYPDRDRFEVSHDTGNKGLRDGILLRLIGQ